MTQPEKQVSAGDSSDGQSSQAKSRRRFQYGISGLMAVAVGVAAWFATMNLKDARWPDGLLAVVVAFFVIGLIGQSWDLGRKLRLDHSLSSEQRWGLRFGIAWRLAIVCVFVGHYVILTLVEMNVLEIQNVDFLNIYSPPLIKLRSGNLFQVALLIVLGSVCANRTRFLKTYFSRTVEIAASTAGTAWIAFTCVHIVLLPCWACFFIWCMQRSYSPHFSEGPIGIQLTRELESAFYYSLLTLICVAIGTTCIIRIGRFWERGPHFRWFNGAISICSLALASIFPAWLFSCAIARLLPIYSLADYGSTWHKCLAGVMAAIACATVVAWRIARRPVALDSNTTLVVTAHRAPKDMYYHERPVILTCLVFAIVARTIIEINMHLPLWDMFIDVKSRYTDAGVLEFLLYFAVWVFFITPTECLNLAIIILASQATWQRWRGRKTPSSRTEYAVSPLCLAGVWLGLIWACAVGVTALFWISWYLCLWPGRFWFW